MKKIMVVMVALMFAFTMAFSGMAFAGGPKGKKRALMTEKAKHGKQVSEDAKAKVNAKRAKAKMGKMDKKQKMKMKREKNRREGQEKKTDE